MKDSQLLHILALQHVSKIGDTTAKKLINHCGSAEAVFKEKRSNLLKIDGIGEVLLSELHKSNHLEAAESELKYIRDEGINCHYFLDETYPGYLT